MKIRTWIISLLMMAVWTTQAKIIFMDTFDHSGAILADMNNNLTTRQSNGVVSSAYTVGYHNQATGSDAYLQDNAAQLSSDVALFRLKPTSASQELRADLDTDFGPSLAGKQWSLSFRNHIASNVGSYVGWTAFGVGNPANAPAGADNGFAMYMRISGQYVIYNRGTLISVNALGIGSIASKEYKLTANFNELAETVELFFETAETNVAMGTFPTDFADSSRFFELKSQVSGDPSFDGTKVVDWRVDDLQIEIAIDPFEEVSVVNLVPNSDFGQVSNVVGDIPGNLLGSFGDYGAFTGRMVEVVGWVPYCNDPSNLVSMVGTPQVNDGVGDLDGTFYLDALYNNNITLNSSTYYRNGVVQSNILDGVTINPSATYTFSVDARKNTATDVSTSTFTAALTSGSDVINMTNVVFGSLLEVAETNLPSFAGIFQAVQISGANLLAAQTGGPVNVLFNHINEEIIPGFPDVTGNVANLDYVAQVIVESISLTVVSPAGDVNKDGVVNQDDVVLAQSYMDGDGGASAEMRQNQLIALGYTSAEALDYLNLTDFDINKDNVFDADDVTEISALLEPLVLKMSCGGNTLGFEWRSYSSKQYDLESSTSLTTPEWAVYDDGSAVYTNIPGSGSGSNTLSGVQGFDSVKFFRIIEKSN